MALWDTLLQAGSGLLGGLLGGTSGSYKNSGSSTTVNQPWSVQQPYLLAGFQDAANAYKNASANPYYSGQLYAGLTPQQMSAINGTLGFSTGIGANAANNVLNNSTGMLNPSSMGMLNASRGLMGMAGTDPTKMNIRDAGSYANNPYLNGAIDAASRDVKRNLTESVLPQVNRVAGATGNTNSSRTGIAEGLALRGAQDRVGDIAATMRGDAWNQGLQTAEAARQANMQGMQSAGGLYNSAWDNALRGAAAGQTMGYNNFDAASKAGGMLQANQQGQLDANLQAYLNKQQMPFNWLNNYMQAVNGNYGYSSTNSANNGQPTWMNTLQGALGGASSGLSLYNNFKNIFSQQ